MEETIEPIEIETPDDMVGELRDDSEALNSVQEPQPTFQPIPNELQECLRWSNGVGSLELYSSQLRLDQLADIGLLFLEAQKKEERRKPNYTG